MTLFANMAMELDTIPPVNIWTGEGDITVGGVSYTSGKGVFQFGNFEQAKNVDQRATVAFPVVGNAARLSILEGVPPVEARLYLIISADYRTFTKRLRLKGRVSNVRVDNLVCTSRLKRAKAT